MSVPRFYLLRQCISRPTLRRYERVTLLGRTDYTCHKEELCMAHGSAYRNHAAPIPLIFTQKYQQLLFTYKVIPFRSQVNGLYLPGFENTGRVGGVCAVDSVESAGCDSHGWHSSGGDHVIFRSWGYGIESDVPPHPEFTDVSFNTNLPTVLTLMLE